MFVTVGTDHHPFERLVDWAARWAERMPDWDVQIQHGRTRAPEHGHGFAFCERERLLELMRDSDLVVCHGGPATITEARRHGHRPLVVPRDPLCGEHVDDHQQLFARRLAAGGVVELVETEDAFLAAAITAAYLPRQRADGQNVPEGVFRIGQIAEDLVSRRKRAARRP
jgi:UDP-N-acetylglucosamine transferase subunit ALG13